MYMFKVLLHLFKNTHYFYSIQERIRLARCTEKANFVNVIFADKRSTEMIANGKHLPDFVLVFNTKLICSFATLESSYLQFRLFILLFMLQRCSIPFCCNYGGYWIPFSMEGCHKMPRSTDQKTLRTKWQRTCLSPAFCRQWLQGNPRIENVYIDFTLFVSC